MDPAYDVGPWADLAEGMAGAAAALAGLLFVAVSINLDAIVATPDRPRYAVAALVTLVSPVFVGLIVLVPAQPSAALGAELLAVAAALGSYLGWLARPAARAPGQPRWAWLLVTVLSPAMLVGSLLLAGVGVLLGALGGLYWLPAAIAVGLLSGLANAWTLLVEIRRPD